MDQNASPAPAPATPPAPQGLQEGAIVSAQVVRLTPSAAVVDFGWKAEGQVPLDDFAKVEGKPAVKVGDKFEVLVDTLSDDPGQVVLSRDKAARLRTWSEVMARCHQGGPVEGTVLAKVSGGFSVSIGVPAFLPNSQVDSRRPEDAAALIGQTLKFGISDFKEHPLKIVLSRKALAREEQKQRRHETLAKLTEGAVVTGVVKSLTDYGAFVDLGGVDGLLHVREMSWTRVDKPREVVQVGQELQVQVLKFDAAAGKVSLGLRQLQPNPWGKVEEKYHPGATVEGQVSSLTEFGAFVTLEPGVEGLIHISEMSWTKKVKHPSEVVKVGEALKAEVLHVDLDARRISLGLRQLQPNPWKVIAEKYPEGSRVHGRVRATTDFGLFVEIEQGVEGLVHVSELSWTEKVKQPSDLYKAGEELDALVLKIDQEDQRISLSVKQLQPSPFQAFEQAHPVGSRLKGRVTRVVDFGAFVELAPGIEGLVHVSELREERVERAAEVVKPNEEIEVQVLEIDARHRKVGLSVKALTELSRAEYQEHLKPVEVKTTLGDLFGDKLKKQGPGTGD